MGRVGLLASRVGPGPHLSLAPALPGGVSVDEFDYFHEMLTHEEIARLGAPSYTDGCGAGGSFTRVCLTVLALTAHSRHPLDSDCNGRYLRTLQFPSWTCRIFSGRAD